ncbi:MAG: helix-turn-helix transcriptional regulator [Flavobacteriales bacterium]|nr:helix-turn-helix transcriptional regulator [Flavobacteriales bacterium]
MSQEGYITDWSGLADKQIVTRICLQIKNLRLEQNITQEQLAERSGLGRASISRIEKGRSVSLLTLVQLLRALNRLDLLNAFQQVQPTISPMQMLEESKVRYRASGKRNLSIDDEKPPSTW